MNTAERLTPERIHAAVDELTSEHTATDRAKVYAEVLQFVGRDQFEDARWSARILSSLPAQFVQPVKQQYRDRYQRKGGRKSANEFLRDVAEQLQGTSLRLAWDDAEVTIAAERHTHHAARIMRAATHRGADALMAVSMYVRSLGIVPPEPDRVRTREGCIARMMCPHWWRRQLRKRHGRAVESLARQLNLVTKNRQCYASQAAVDRRRSQKRRNRQMMEEMHGTAIDDDGIAVHSATLAELHDASVSNPELKRGELMCRLRGFELAAKIAGHVALFITVTAPGEYHRAYAKTGQQNPNWNGTTPRQVHAFLQGIWTRTRASWKRSGFDVYGFRIAEPHHDGTPHWHLLVFLHAGEADIAIGAFKGAAHRAGVVVDGGGANSGKDAAGFKVERIDPGRGSAVGYVAKYIAKNIDGHKLDDDLLGNTGQDAATRIDAWASTWGIRQFQQFGGPKVTVWRELRRLRAEPVDSGRMVRLAWRAADRGQWRRFCRFGSGVHLLKEVSAAVNRYGERAAAHIIGVLSAAGEVVTRCHVWVFERAQRATWTRVNNCTHDIAELPPVHGPPPDLSAQSTAHQAWKDVPDDEKQKILSFDQAVATNRGRAAWRAYQEIAAQRQIMRAGP